MSLDQYQEPIDSTGRKGETERMVGHHNTCKLNYPIITFEKSNTSSTAGEEGAPFSCITWRGLGEDPDVVNRDDDDKDDWSLEPLKVSVRQEHISNSRWENL